MDASRSRSHRLARVVGLTLLAGLCACASQARSTKRLPFHVAIAPATITKDDSARTQEGNPTELTRVFDDKMLQTRLGDAVGQAFTKVSRLTPAAAGTLPSARAKAWIDEAQRQGADLLLVPSLRYDPKIHSELNNQFWPNLLFFAIGGPFCWWLPDRTYYSYSLLDGQIYDVTAAASSTRQALDQTSHVLNVPRESTASALNFVDRASGAGTYLLSVICPAGFLATESAGIPAVLDTTVTDQLCSELTTSLQDRAAEITGGSLVAFFPQDVRVTGEGNGRSLVGEFVLKLGGIVDNLGKLRYRTGSSEEWKTAEWAPVQSSETADRKVYPFVIRLDGVTSDSVQVQVEQLDPQETKRTFTFAVGQARAQ